MSKRQIRLNTTQSILRKLPEIYGKKVNIVLRSGEVTFVQILSHNDTSIQVSNMRIHSSEIELNKISEVILDLEA